MSFAPSTTRASSEPRRRASTPRRARGLEVGPHAATRPERQVDLTVHHRQRGGAEPWRWLGRASRCEASGPNLREIVAGEVGHVRLHASSALPARYADVRTHARVRVLRRAGGAGAAALCETSLGFGAHAAADVPLSYGPLREAGEFLLAVTLEDGHIRGSPFRLRVLPAGPCARTSELAPAPDEALPPKGGGKLRSATRAGRLGVFIVRVRDAFGNDLQVGGHPIGVRFAPRGGAAGAAEPLAAAVSHRVADRGDGSYAVSYATTRAGRYDATVTLDGEPLGCGPMRCAVRSGPTLPSAVLLRLGAEHERAGTGTAGQPLALSLLARDHFGNRREVGGDSWRVELVPQPQPHEGAAPLPSGGVVHGRLRDRGDGSYALSATPTAAGAYLLRVLALDGSEVAHSPLPIRVAAGRVDGRGSRAHGELLEAGALVCGEPAAFCVTLADGHGNALSAAAELGSLAVSLRHARTGEPDAQAGVFARAQGGQLQCELTTTLAGPKLLHVAVGGVAVLGSPFRLRALPARPHGPSCALSLATAHAVAGEELRWTLHARDKFSNRCAGEPADVQLLARRLQRRFDAGEGEAAELRGSAAALRDGSYALTLVVEQAAVWAVRVTIDGQPVDGAAPARVHVRPAAASARTSRLREADYLEGATLRCGEWAACVLLPADRFGNALTAGGEAVAASCSACEEPVLMRELEGGGGYELAFRPARLGVHTLRVALPHGGGDVLGSPFRLHVVAGAADARHSSASGAALDGGALRDGSGAFTITGRDAHGHPCEAGGDPFAVTIVPRSHSHYGHVHTFADRADGSYDVAFTTAVSGRYHVAVTLRGQHIAGSPFPVRSSAAPPAHLRATHSPRATHRAGSPPWPMRGRAPVRTRAESSLGAQPRARPRSASVGPRPPWAWRSLSGSSNHVSASYCY